jgi:hypothetical protein
VKARKKAAGAVTNSLFNTLLNTFWRRNIIESFSSSTWTTFLSSTSPLFTSQHRRPAHNHGFRIKTQETKGGQEEDKG